MNHLESSYQTHDGLSLYLQAWVPKHPKATVFLVHGLGEHSSRYDFLVERFTENNIAVFTFDGRGHGKSSIPKPDAYIDKYEEYLKDIDSLYNKATAYFPNLPIFIYGHSMGGALVARYVLTYKPTPTGIILSAAALRPAEGTSKLLIALSSLVSKCAPKLKTIKLDPSYISLDDEVVEEYINDPLVYNKAVPARTAHELLRMMKDIEIKAHKFTLPVLILHGSDDKLTNPKGSEAFFEAISSPDKTLISYPGLYHELHHEPKKNEVVSDLISWMEQRTG
ncbi:alpha/beta hydrolase [Anditalea andensis]|uniref:Monoacylglycerol lipase n=1 Tax=Anditalea andensis TaxID=1048983 RepID=A0A074KUZ1_9BACT|nr:alpha/beta hydrolase [Anditalea andensis]KEO72065.1 alpha/beta hydrolase [Anditalea andensis]